jgi:hypothetical protein
MPIFGGGLGNPTSQISTDCGASEYRGGFEKEEMKKKYRIFRIVLFLFVSLAVVIAIGGTQYGASFMAVFYVLLGILGWSFFFRKAK